MKPRPQRPWPSRRARLLVPLALLVVLALVLSWRQPWRAPPPVAPRPVSLVPTPGPPTATRPPERVALPTVLPHLAVTPTAIATPTLPRSTPSADFAGAGTLLYLGAVDGRFGIISANADGSDRRILVHGLFDTIAWSPDGSRFAASGPIPEGGGAYQVAIFAPDGRPLARYPFERQVSRPLAWSPDGKRLLCYVPSGDAGSFDRLDVWVLGPDGAWQVARPPAMGVVPYRWTPDGRLAFFTSNSPNLIPPLTLWTTDAEGRAPVKVYEGAFAPLGWNIDGSLLYALAYTSSAATAAPTRLIAIELPWGTVRHIIGADELAVSALGAPFARDVYRFDFSSLSPDGTQFALTLSRGSGAGTSLPRAEARTGDIILMRSYGQIAGIARLSGNLWPPGWSPDSKLVSIFAFGDKPDQDQLHILDTTGVILVTIPARRRAEPLGPPQVAWSPDSRWLAIAGPGGLVIAAASGPPRSYALDTGGSAPAWRPARRP